MPGCRGRQRRGAGVVLIYCGAAQRVNPEEIPCVPWHSSTAAPGYLLWQPQLATAVAVPVRILLQYVWLYTNPNLAGFKEGLWMDKRNKELVPPTFHFSCRNFFVCK